MVVGLPVVALMIPRDAAITFVITMLIIVVIAGLPTVFIRNLQRRNFGYQLQDEYLVIYAGIINRIQRHVPYSVIQDIIIAQDVADRFLGISRLNIENAAQSGAESTAPDGRGQSSVDSPGFLGTSINIPGLRAADAQLLKVELLQKMVANKARNSNSGL